MSAKHNAKPYLLMAFSFGCLYALISFTNHYFFRTYALDLGLYTNASYSYSQLTMATQEMINRPEHLALADHFDLYLMFFAPLRVLFGTYTLLVVQIFSLLIGGLGIYRYFQENKRIAYQATFFFFSFFGVISAVSFDYHSNVVTAALLPWLFVFMKNRRFFASFLLLIFLWIGKENMPFWLCFVCLGMALLYRKDRPKMMYSLMFSMASLLFFLLTIKVIIPALSNEGNYSHFAFSALGNDLGEAFLYLIRHPIDSIVIFFTNHSGDSNWDYIKLETHIILLLSGVALLFRKPAYLIMLIPIYFQKFFHDQSIMWSHSAQYSVEFAPILAIGVFSIIQSVRQNRLKILLGITTIVLSIGATIRTMDQPFKYYPGENIQFYKSTHYTKTYDVEQVHFILDLIPDDAIVSTQSVFIPHLALRDHIYQFPMINDAEYIVLSTHESPYPTNFEALHATIDSLSMDPNWKHTIQTNHLQVFERN